MKFILGTKKNMTQVFHENGSVVPVTRIQAGPCVVTQTRKEASDKSFVQFGFGTQKVFRLSRAEQGHLKDVSFGQTGETVRVLREVPTDASVTLKKGDQFTVSVFEKGDKVSVIGTSKGKGFQGVVKRHGFSGSPATHGHKDQERMPGSIGATGPQRVFKGTRMGGHMGDQQVTVKNLEIIEVLPESNELLIKGAIPGARGSIVLITMDGGAMAPTEVVVESPLVPKEEVAQEELTSTETPAEVENTPVRE